MRVCAAVPSSCRREAALFSANEVMLLGDAYAARPAGSKTVPRSGKRRCISEECGDVQLCRRHDREKPHFFGEGGDAFGHSVRGTSCGFKKQCRIPKHAAAFQRGIARTLATKLRQTSSDGFRYARSAALPSHTYTARSANSSSKRRPPFRKPPRFLQAFGGRAPSGRACAAKIHYRSVRSIFAPSAFSSFSRDS